MPAQSSITVTTGGVWTTLATGEGTIASLMANARANTTLVALRLTLAGGATSYILPTNSLKVGSPSRIVVGGISLQPNDKLEALSNDAVEWVTSVIPGTAYKSLVATSPGSGAWTTLATGPCLVRGVFACVPNGGEVSCKVKKAAQEAFIVTDEKIGEAESKRIIMPIQLLAGDTLQVKGTSSAFWIATGVQV